MKKSIFIIIALSLLCNGCSEIYENGYNGIILNHQYIQNISEEVLKLSQSAQGNGQQ